MVITKDDKIVLECAQQSPTGKGTVDTDFAIVRLLADGAVDTTFATQGKFLLDINKQNASVRALTQLPDGSLIPAGYTRDANGVVSPVLFKLTPAGALDESFGVKGVFNQIVLASVTEAYGPLSRATSWSPRATGATTRTSRSTGSRCGSLAPGSSTPPTASTASPASTSTRRPTTAAGWSFWATTACSSSAAASPRPRTPRDGDGAHQGRPARRLLRPERRKLYDLGAPTDMFWGVALSPDKKTVAIVGAAAYAANSGTDDDGVLFLLPVAQ